MIAIWSAYHYRSNISLPFLLSNVVLPPMQHLKMHGWNPDDTAPMSSLKKPAAKYQDRGCIRRLDSHVFFVSTSVSCDNKKSVSVYVKPLKDKNLMSQKQKRHMQAQDSLQAGYAKCFLILERCLHLPKLDLNIQTPNIKKTSWPCEGETSA